MKLKSLAINYFMSFGPDNIIDLADRGLVLINGVNNISATASSNGAGKTNLQEALLWCIFGETSKGVPANDVVNNIHKKDCFVKAIFDTEEFEYHIDRYRKHSEFGDDLHFYRIKDGEKENLAGVDKSETQKRIEQFIGCSFTLFCNSAYFSQGNVKPFSTFTDKQIKEVFIDALNMGRFTQALEKVRFDLRTLREELANLEGRKTRIKEEIIASRARQEDYRTKHAGFSEAQTKDLSKLEKDIIEIQGRIETLRTGYARISDLTLAIEEQSKTLTKLPDNLANKSSLAEAANRFRNSYRLLNHEFINLQKRLSDQTNELKFASKRIGTNCSECGKPIIEADLADVIASIKAQIDMNTVELAKMKGLMERATPRLSEFQTKEDIIQIEIDECTNAEKKIAELKVAIARLETAKREVLVLEGNLRDLKAAKLKRAEEKSPWEAYIKAEQDKITEAETTIAALLSVIDEKKAEITYAEYWEAAFGYSGIPSFLLDSVTPFLVERSNHYSSVITAGEIEIDFSTVSKTKKGELKDKFAISVNHRFGAKAYKGTSGGERKRADICIAQSILDLVRSFGRNSLAYCSYDEPFEDLDNEGVAYVIEMLNEIAKEIGTVLVVTHNNELKSMFENTITVVKEKDGFSRIAA